MVCKKSYPKHGIEMWISHALLETVLHSFKNFEVKIVCILSYIKRTGKQCIFVRVSKEYFKLIAEQFSK